VSQRNLRSSKIGPPTSIVAFFFRPLFVYKQQEIKRQKVNEQKQKNQTKKPSKPTKRAQG
jgi:hypothetical protein